ADRLARHRTRDPRGVRCAGALSPVGRPDLRHRPVAVAPGCRGTALLPDARAVRHLRDPGLELRAARLLGATQPHPRDQFLLPLPGVARHLRAALTGAPADATHRGVVADARRAAREPA